MYMKMLFIYCAQFLTRLILPQESIQVHVLWDIPVLHSYQVFVNVCTYQKNYIYNEVKKNNNLKI